MASFIGAGACGDDFKLDSQQNAADAANGTSGADSGVGAGGLRQDGGGGSSGGLNPPDGAGIAPGSDGAVSAEAAPCADLSDCDGVCVDLSTSTDHCGRCGVPCNAGEICVDGSCACRADRQDCGEGCTDLSTDERHCGGCNAPCDISEYCSGGECGVGRPCDGLCAAAESLVPDADGFRAEPLGVGARCLEVTAYDPIETGRRIVCWEFSETRLLQVNGQVVECLTDPGIPLGEERNGGYCITVSAGDYTYAGILLPVD